MAEEFATKADVAELKTELLERIEKVETTLLNEFRKWAVPFGARTRVFEATGAGLTERVTLLEERVNGLEKK